MMEDIIIAVVILGVAAIICGTVLLWKLIDEGRIFRRGRDD
jgi:hypothetical protein